MRRALSGHRSCQSVPFQHCEGHTAAWFPGRRPPLPARPVEIAHEEARADLIPAFVTDGLELGLGRSRRHRRGSYRLRRHAIAECREDAFARWLGCADMWSQRSLRREIELSTIVGIGDRLRRWHRLCVFRLRGYFGQQARPQHAPRPSAVLFLRQPRHRPPSG